MTKKEMPEKILPKNLYQAVSQNAEKYPEKTAVEDNWGRKVSYTELILRADQFAYYLKNVCEVKEGSHVGIAMYSSVEFAIAYLALIRIGAVAVMLPTKFREEELNNLVQMSDLTLLICEESLSSRLSEAIDKIPSLIYKLREDMDSFKIYLQEREKSPCESTSQDIAVMMFTSGTTSLSKGVLLSNSAMMKAAEVYKNSFNITDQDSTVIPVPIYMITGLSALFDLTLYSGGTVYMQQFFEADKILSCIRDKGVTFFHAAPTVYALLCAEREKFPDLPSLRIAACGGSRVSKELERKMKEWLPSCEFRTVYGMTETASPATILPENASESPHPLSNGKPIPDLQIKIIGTDGMECAPEEIGEIWMKGPNLLTGYYKKETESFQNGWLHTGDVGYQTKDGYVYVVDRIKDMINRGGEKVFCYDVEQALISIGGISEAAVVGIPHEIYGEAPVALVVTEKDALLTEDEIRKILKEKIAGYKVPGRIFFGKELPLTPNGKVNKKEIRKYVLNMFASENKES